ncbi:MAG TPA: DUF4058 family protein, partial [Caldilineaceae bacterium]|nr:DUF4058 family protein [Caldilineaceae bacterium]
ALATEIRNRLAAAVRPRYVARLAIKTIHETIPATEITVIYPDVEILRRQLRERSSEPYPAAVVQEPATTISPALMIPLLELQQRMVTVELYTVENKELVTCIEVLSPANKRGDGLRQYLHKRTRLHRAGVHLLEIDLTRRGRRPMFAFAGSDIEPEPVKAKPYLISLWRAGHAALKVWPVALDEPLPTVAVPLREPDPDVPLDLTSILATVYDTAAYDLSVDYSQEPPPPAFDQTITAWISQRVGERRRAA